MQRILIHERRVCNPALFLFISILRQAQYDRAYSRAQLLLLPNFPTSHLPDFPSFGLPDFPTSGLSDFLTSGPDSYRDPDFSLSYFYETTSLSFSKFIPRPEKKSRFWKKQTHAIFSTISFSVYLCFGMPIAY